LKWLALVVDLLVGVTPNLAKAVKPANVDTFVVMRTSPNGKSNAMHCCYEKDVGMEFKLTPFPAETVRSITAVVPTWTCLFKKKEL
jgi:hypothetical protein